MSLADDLERLYQLYQQGALNEREYADAKAKLLASSQSASFQSSFDNAAHINKLRRSASDKWLGGVCGGLAKFTQVESWLWRLVFFMAFVFGGMGLVAYLIAWVFIPEENSQNAHLPY